MTDKLDVPAQRTHDLILLSQQLKIETPPELFEQLRNITKFNLEARYDTFKREFYKKATHEYAGEWLKITQEILLWLKKN